MTDDQDVELGGLTPMRQTRERLGEQGAVGEAFYIATPICCPSRTETLSGRLYHNVLSDDLSGCMHVNSTSYIFEHESSLFPALQRQGLKVVVTGHQLERPDAKASSARVRARRDSPHSAADVYRP